MATHRDIQESETETLAPVTQTLVQALADNPVAMAEGDDTAPVVQAGWHPYDKVTYGDTNDGLLWDFDVDGNSNAVSLNFTNGYEYRIHVLNLKGSSGGYDLEIFAQGLGTYNTAWTVSNLNASASYHAIYDLVLPRKSSDIHYVLQAGSWHVSGTPSETGNVISLSSASRIQRVRFSPTALTAGQVYVSRRLNPLSK